MRLREWGKAFAVFGASLTTTGPAFAIPPDQSVTYVYAPFILLLLIIVPYKIWIMAHAARRPPLLWVVPVVVGCALSVYLTLPLNFYGIPFDPNRYVWLICLSAGLLFLFSYVIDSFIFVLLRPFDGIERVMLGIVKANGLVFGVLACFGVFMWNFSPDVYELMVDVGNMLTASARPYSPLNLIR